MSTSRTPGKRVTNEGIRFERLLADLSARFVIERATILSPGPTLRVELPASVDLQAAAGMTLEVIERRHFVAVLDEVRWRIRGEGGAAQRLGLKPSTLESRMRKRHQAVSGRVLRCPPTYRGNPGMSRATVDDPGAFSRRLPAP